MDPLPEENDPWHTPLLVLFVISCGINWFYGLSRWANLIHAVIATRFFTDNPDEKSGRIRPGKEPHVTIQICSYNEGAVIKETINRACSVDWPRNKLTVQVLDDSTDQSSCRIIDEAVASWQENGVNVARMTRPQRVGYKAGSLRFHFPSVHSKFVAHFDADHLMEPDFLRRAMPYFFDKDGEEKPDVGVVQAPWGYYNMRQSLLTECDALALDVHHVIEQTGRSAVYGVFGFNGTGGIWRKSAVADAGGWTWETVTEDLALSYNAYIKGYKFVYARNIPQRLEVPGNFLAHIQQKNRWTKGFLQVFRYSYWDILTSRKISTLSKWEALCHITGPIQFTSTIVCVFIYPFLMVHSIDSWFIKAIAFGPAVEPVVSGVVTCYAKVPGSGHGEYRGFWRRTSRLAFLFPYFGLKLGMALFETKAVLEGLFSNDATFLTTPKEGSAKSSSSANSVKRQSADDIIAMAGLTIGVARIMVLLHFTSLLGSVREIFVLLMNITTGISLIWVNVSFLHEKHVRSTSKPMIRMWRNGHLLYVLLIMSLIGVKVYDHAVY